MSRLFYITWGLCAFPFLTMAQQSTPPAALPANVTQSVDLSFATKGNFTTTALSVSRLHGVGRHKRFRIGYGLRFTSAFGKNTTYRTAPARLTSGKHSIFALFSEDLVQNIDTLKFPVTQINSFNISIHLEYALTRKVAAGFNIDGIGFSFGSDRSSTFTSKGTGRSALTGSTQQARPTAFNLLLISDSDIGSLNSEAYVRYQVAPKLSLRAGLNFQFNEYQTRKKLIFDNDRYRTKNLMPMLAIAYHF
ncbi:hypothetical protein [Arsenicibacter rosenii]|uniref:Outer membrane protein beta-barrel domain-containing protein n=1 Tax=Arsenicibacter rosenii TaxID=1750698 RepID=A0A1S2VFL6_9BACT|nr:hypothetical protein [Arsenicibacter rosenii]OIN57504.1 hypothetical protein BLX24_19970 [Arsenicibacter rosenii]